LYASSSSAYEPDLNPYAASKYIVEEAAERYVNTLGMRFHTVYSDLPRKGMFLDKLINNQLEYVTTHYRDFIHIEDLCDAIELLMESQLNGILDIGTGNNVKVQTLAPELPIRLNTVHERQYTKANIEKLSNLGFKPKYNIKKFLTNKNLGTII
jgi:nucleoside-diphosphate-sugar epimerase